MSFAKLMELVKDNSEAMDIAKSLEALMTSLTTKVNDLELKASDVITSRDKVKSQLRLVKDKLGIDELTDETLSNALKQKPDEKVQTELKNLQLQLSKAVAEKEEVEASYKSKMGNLVLKTELNKTGLAQDARNPESYALLESLVLQGATYSDDGTIIFKNDDGSTAYGDGKPLSLADKVAALKNNIAYEGLFNPQGKSGGGSNPTIKPGSAKSFKDMTEAERITLYKQNPEEYRRIAKQQ